MTNGPTLATAMTPEGTLGHELARIFAPPGACVWGQLCMYVCTGMANSPSSWCAGNMSPPRLPPLDSRHLLPGHLLHGCTIAGAGVPCCARTDTGDRCGRAALCAHGRVMPVTSLRARRLSSADAMGSLTRPAAGAQATCSPPRLPPGDRCHLLPGHLLHGCTVAGAGVPCCARTGTGGRCGRAELCTHGLAMPVTRLRVLLQMPHPRAAVRSPLGRPYAQMVCVIVYVQFSSVGAGMVWGGAGFFSSFWDRIWVE
jgi:hypothetical protein